MSIWVKVEILEATDETDPNATVYSTAVSYEGLSMVQAAGVLLGAAEALLK